MDAVEPVIVPVIVGVLMFIAGMIAIEIDRRQQRRRNESK
jgi:hypothetical protein